ncbi:MAG: hypothetical protein RM347_002010 [Nostoc sp. ChiQUE02]|uniref:hypothetical protein n=1 Tax=Nostoc sp. ChiQUE02 TaxID=3075377 RepID=UPI002AD53F28|nr:hypothetical protein [Nostoc sp. ChiQUE02]MDZ8235512.1 hypothetical protein [Nostoc sp. ChiQUE02]
MKYKLQVFLLLLSLFASVSTSINAVVAQEINQNFQLITDNTEKEASFTKAPKPTDTSKELQAFFRSQYDYWDARILANYWGQSVEDAKARIGRKILWGRKDVAILEQFLLDARVKALQSVGTTPNSLYNQSKYKYDDAALLAKFWGDPSPWDAKLRIERNLILGNDEIIEEALQYARTSK